MSMTVSIRVAHKSPSLAKGQRHHDMRQSHVPDYVDRDRSSMNSVLLEPMLEASLRSICLERRALRDTKRAMKQDAAVATIGIVTFGSDAQPVIQALSIADQDALYMDAAQRIAAELKSDVTGLVVHRDESAPHAHFQMPAYNREGMPLSKVITPEVAKRLQDIAGSIYNAHGITRGTPKAVRIERGDDVSKTMNRTVKQLHKDMPKEIAAKEARLVTLIKEESALEAGIKQKTEAHMQILKQNFTVESKLATTLRATEAYLDGLAVIMPENESIKEARKNLLGAKELKADDLLMSAISFRNEAKTVRKDIEVKPEIAKEIDTPAPKLRKSNDLGL